MVASDINDPEHEVAEPANLKFLRRLVTVLTATMIGGLLILIALVVIRLQQPATPLALPEEIMLPDGAIAQAFTQGRTWYAVVTADDEILIYDRANGSLIQTIQINPH